MGHENTSTFRPPPSVGHPRFFGFQVTARDVYLHAPCRNARVEERIPQNVRKRRCYNALWVLPRTWHPDVSRGLGWLKRVLGNPIREVLPSL